MFGAASYTCTGSVNFAEFSTLEQGIAWADKQVSDGPAIKADIFEWIDDMDVTVYTAWE